MPLGAPPNVTEPYETSDDQKFYPLATSDDEKFYPITIHQHDDVICSTMDEEVIDESKLNDNFDVEHKKDSNDDRVSWGTKADFLLSVIGYAVDLGSQSNYLKTLNKKVLTNQDGFQLICGGFRICVTRTGVGCS